MKKFKRIIIILLCFIVFVITIRASLYRLIIKYEPIEKRQSYVLENKVLIEICDLERNINLNTSVKDVILSSLQITSKYLEFTFTIAEKNPNLLIETTQANCIGYAAFFSAICNYQLLKLGYSKNWSAIPYKSYVYLLGVNLHQHINSPFFKDHDFVIIENKVSKERFIVDPVVKDYLFINFVSCKEPKRNKHQ